MSRQATIHIVDDDEPVRRSLQRLLDSAGLVSISYATPKGFLEAVPNLPEGCVLLDVRMPGLDGLEVQTELEKLGCTMPVIIMTGQGDVQTAVRAMKAGAIDFIEKPFNEEVLLDAIRSTLARSGHSDSGREAIEAAERLGKLSPREREVLDALMAGHQNKVIAFDLSISVRTVEVHRARMMHRLGVRQLAEAIRLAVLAKLALPDAKRHSPTA